MAKKKNKKWKNKPGKRDTSLLTGGQIPRNIMGAEFDPSLDDLSILESRITNAANKDLDEIRVLMVSEASYLHTGFSTYTKNILSRLSKVSNITCAELGAYGHGADKDPRAEGIEWKYYSNMPIDDEETKAYQSNYAKNQFGTFKFHQTMEDFKPDVILLHRDHWMDEDIVNHNLSKKCHIIWMACIDSYPQKWEWLRDYGKADTLMAYSHFGKKVLEEQSRTRLAEKHNIAKLDCQTVAQAGVDPSKFKPLDKAATKAKFGIAADLKIIGTVMRNQPRKLFTRIIDSYADLLVKYPKVGSKTALLLHTGIPDVGFDIPESVFRNGVEHRVLFSYICHKCGFYGVDTWGFTNRPCKSCQGTECVTTPNTNKGLSTEQFNEVYNIMDLYVQGSIAGADEMPATEAKACGVPVTCTDYAAMYEKNRNGGGLPIKVGVMYTEAETMQNRAMFSNESLTENMHKVLSSDFYAKTLATEARQTVLDHYNWDLTAKKWEAAILEADLKGRHMWEAKTVSAFIDTEGATQEEIDKTIASLSAEGLGGVKIVDQITLDLKEVSSDWTITLKAGEELINPRGSFDALRTEAYQNDSQDLPLTMLALEETEYGINLNGQVSSPRFAKSSLVESDGSPLMLTSSSENANFYMTWVNIQNMPTSTEEESANKAALIKNRYPEVSTAIMRDILNVPYIIRKRK
jgi:glycosyltransferase involved in cell wall biosynthesis